MSRVVAHQSMSLDGYTAGPEQTLENPIGIGSGRLHAWMFAADEPGHEVDAAWRADLHAPLGAVVMGRNMFGPVRGEWPDETWRGWWGEEPPYGGSSPHHPRPVRGEWPDETWRGWWGEEPPYGAPVFVLTHHPRPSLEMTGTTFHFVTEGFDVAFARAQEAAGEGTVRIAGGASTVRQALERGVVDELSLDIVPFLLGGGERLFDGIPDPGLVPVEVLHSPLATHIRYHRAP